MVMQLYFQLWLNASDSVARPAACMYAGVGRKIQLHRQREAALQPWMKIDLELWLWRAFRCLAMLWDALHDALC